MEVDPEDILEAIPEDADSYDELAAAEPEIPKRGRGRPKGSRNKPKIEKTEEEIEEIVEIPSRLRHRSRKPGNLVRNLNRPPHRRCWTLSLMKDMELQDLHPVERNQLE